ncbi:receptor-like protein kinase 1 [Forsythia ovata]|uniref:Receptor-like protein kinase 1 n=1 Tax=Forsythia ovata TaxID=205694 RepID=A0ABD1T5P2_9LAMI
MAFAVSIRMLFVLLFFLPLSATSQPYRNVTLGSSLTANNANSIWLSPSGEFAFGFQQIIPGGYLLAIWFNKITERTIVWSANRDNLVQEGSKVQLFADGRFELSDPRGQQIWAATLSGVGVAYGAMLDTGNFVLANNSSVVLWQSFEEPTDTLLPTQTLNQDGRLVSSFSKTNYSRGRFLFTLQTDGNLVSYTRNFPMDDVIFAYWSTQTMGSGFQVIFNQSGYIFLVAKNGSILNFVASNAVSTSQFYQRAILEYDGVLRHYVYPKYAHSEGGRAMAWSTMDFIPSNICTRITQSTGSGACGFNSFCSLGTDQMPNCDCPVGYSVVDPNDRMSGCKPKFAAQNCDEEARETDLFSFIALPNTDWPLSDYAYFHPVTEDWCRQVCLDDCFCTVAIYRDGNCWKKKYPLSNGRVDSNVGGKALIKIRNNDATV